MKTKKIKFLNLLVSLIGLLLISTEIYLNFKKSTLCKTQGCLLVHIFDTYGILNYLGFSVFLFLFIISFLDLINFYLGFFLKLRTYILSICVIVEGYFIGFQIWSLQEFCYYCLIIAGIIFLAFLMDYIYPKKERSIFLLEFTKNTVPYKLGILGFFSFLMVSYLIRFPLNSLNFNSPIVLYKDDCPYCEEVINYAKEKEIKVEVYKVEKFFPLVKALNLNSVPILIYKENGKISILNGFKEIKEWLSNRISQLDLSQKEKEVTYLKKQIKKEKIEPVLNTSQSRNKSENFINEQVNEQGVCTLERPCD